MRYIFRRLKKAIKFFLLYHMPENKELRRISKIKRHTLFTTNILGFRMEGGDSSSFLGQYNEIIKKEIYSFCTQTDTPYIIDCGANIGVSVLYFKMKYPNAEVVAFEPDRSVFSLLSGNIIRKKLTGITIINKGVWNKDGVVKFSGKGDDAGKIVEENPQNPDWTEIEVISLRPYLNRKVQMLKIDIEGAEFEVINNISDLLLNVERVFIEYHSIVKEEQKLHYILEILRNSGFRYFIEQTTLFNTNPFIKIATSNDLDNLINIYGYRSNTI